MHIRILKKQLLPVLGRSDFEANLLILHQFPPRRTVNALISLFHNKKEIIKWRAVTAMGIVVSRLANQDIESSRVIMRRLMWTLNDESGGIGWGSPEAMGEIMAQHDRLAGEYAHILVSYIQPGGNFLEYEALQRGVLWGIGRLSPKHLNEIEDVHWLLKPFFSSNDPYLRGLSVRAAGNLKLTATQKWLEQLADDHAVFSLYRCPDIQTLTVGRMVADALGTLVV
jgi:hypothetical protein